jgi:hypothetical protein
MLQTPEYYDVRIARLKAKIKRLLAEKRVVILRRRERELSVLANKGGNDDR